MQVLKLIEEHTAIRCMVECDCQLAHQIGLPIDSGGSDGEIYALPAHPDKVIKLCVIYDLPIRPLTVYSQIQQTLDYVIETQPEAFVRVYEHGYLGTYSRPEQPDFLLYYYTMERLQKITEDEEKIFHSILSHEDRGIEKNYSTDKIREMLQEMSRGLDFDLEKIMLFFRRLSTAGIKQHDLHQRNVMKCIDGDFRIIDLDRCQLKQGETNNGKASSSR